MKNIYLNLKRFDVSKDEGGINNLASVEEWGKAILGGISEKAGNYDNLEFDVFLPEGHLINAASVANNVGVGCQGVHRQDVTAGGNFGAFTTLTTAKAATGMGATYALIGHCEERNNLREIITLGGGDDYKAIDRILNDEIKCALKAGMKVLYCIGERFEEMDDKKAVLQSQLDLGLADVDISQVSVGYEPVWAIGPGRPVPTYEYIKEVADFIKSLYDVRVVYGGGLKTENASMIASVDSIDGGLIALTTFGENFGFSLEDFFEIVDTYNEEVK